MSQQRNQQEMGVRYLLGTLSEAEEERYFSDEEFENTEIAEDEVVDSYVRGKLAAHELEHFEKVLASSPRLVQRVKIARLLRNEIEIDSREQVSEVPIKAAVAKSSWWNRWFGSSWQLAPGYRGAMVAAMALIIVVGIGLFTSLMNSRRDSQQLASDKAQLELRIRELQAEIEKEKTRTTDLDRILKTRQDELSEKEKQLQDLRAQLDNPQRPVTASVFTFVTLQAGATRSGGGPDVVLKPNSSEVAITLQLRASDHSSYNAFLETPERGVVHRARRLRPRNTGDGPTISFRVPANKVKPSDYTVRLEAPGSNVPVDEYFFRVVAPK